MLISEPGHRMRAGDVVATSKQRISDERAMNGSRVTRRDLQERRGARSLSAERTCNYGGVAGTCEVAGTAWRWRAALIDDSAAGVRNH